MTRPDARRPMHWPGQCELCRRWTQGRLCTDCAPPAQALRCASCGLRLQAAAGTPDTLRCGTCLAHPLPFRRCLCAVDYLPPWDRLIVAFKYHGALDLAPALAQRLGDALDAGRGGVAGTRVDLVLPMPLSTTRLAERGYNQAWELARRVARGQRRPASPRVLQRWLETAPQAGLDRAARQRNLQGAFVVALPQAVAGRHVALVDDVLTTGASVGAAALALRAAGAASVRAWVLARTP